ncbi:hypothetical protein VPNG_02084 [Cytospora leucostoma]|uniref:SprT-like domain-containing protein n=1 Tax=Cytospora leucostoma TaxID=1230097 RepID=A0A423XHY4_9PEZI|nr:hypothetical protein VPNG_02084 [Cytospora leucostoma]
MRGRRIIVDSSDEEFPDIRQIGSSHTNRNKDARSSTKQPEESVTKSVVRRRKLGPISDNANFSPSLERSFSRTLFDDDDAALEKSSRRPRRLESISRPSTERSSSRTLFDDDDAESTKSSRRPRRLDASLHPPTERPFSRTLFDDGFAGLEKPSRRPRRLDIKARRPSPVTKSFEVEELSEPGSVQEETIIEEISADDGSDCEARRSPGSESDSSTGELFLERSPPRSPKGLGGNSEARRVPGAKARSPSPSAQLLAEASRAQERNDRHGSTRKRPSSKSESTFKNTEGQKRTMRTGLLSDLDISDVKRPTTPPSPAPEPKYKTLASPSKKIHRIPATPHRPTTDTFWDQEFIDEWNDEHSPKKQLFSPSATPQSPTKKSPAKKGPSQAAIAKATKKAFEESKHELADNFLRELDSRITDGRISELSASTGGVRIDWSNRLNTTAGRANWRRETTRRKDTETGAVTSTSYRHHASIELAEKVIDDEARLLNVIAHEFCHLANFMISGVTNNPHGREFKAWAARVTAAFGDERGIEVTTKHSYDIDFRYVWECAGCGVEYKRHSRSINTDRHRCGACKGELRQTKPVPRARPAGESEYQRFMKEQMKVIRLENPGCPMRDIMKLVASRWSQQEKEKGESGGKEPGNTFSSSSSSAAASTSSQVINGGKKKVESVRRSLNTLTLIDLT